MKLTQPEMVTREYCDECGVDITRDIKYGTREDDTKPWHVICGKCYSKARWAKYHADKVTRRNKRIKSQPFY